MKINNVSGAVGAYQKAGVRKVAQGQDVARPGKSDAVQLSREAHEVRALKDKLAQAPEVRKERIAELKRQIETGTYQPDGREVAAKLMKARVFDDLA